MIWLVWSDLVIQHRSVLALLPVTAVLMGVLAVAMGAQAANAMPVMLLAMMAWGNNLRAAYEDDKADLWVLLKVLPIPPARVVGARYLAGALVTGAFGLAVAAPLAWLTPAGTGWQAAVGAGLGAGLVLGALFNAIYYRSGYRTVSTWFRFILLLFVVPFLLVGRLRETALVQAVTRAMSWLDANPGTGAAVGAAAILVLYLASWAYAAASFSRRELT